MPGGRRRRSRKGGNWEPPTDKAGCDAVGGDWYNGKCLPSARGGRRRRRTMRGGMGHGFAGETIGTAGIVNAPSWGGEVTKGGQPIYDAGDRPPVTGGRRKSKKAGKKAGKRRRRTMRGGAQWQSVGGVGYSFMGAGERGLANVGGYASKVAPDSAVQNPDGAFRA